MKYCSKIKNGAVDLSKICIVLNEYSGSKYALDKEKKNYCLRYIRSSYSDVLKMLKSSSWYFTLEPIYRLLYYLGCRKSFDQDFLKDDNIEASLLELNLETGLRPDLKFVEYEDKIVCIVDLNSNRIVWSSKMDKEKEERRHANKHNQRN